MMEKEELIERLESEFECDQHAAGKISDKAGRLAEYVQSDPEEWAGPSEIDADYIISRLDMATDHLDVVGKWN